MGRRKSRVRNPAAFTISEMWVVWFMGVEPIKWEKMLCYWPTTLDLMGKVRPSWKNHS